MEIFKHDGHLTEQALRELTSGGELPELTRLEIAEHLSYCDRCLQRYTALLERETLRSPSALCQETLWKRIRLRVLRGSVSRYATTAAAVALAILTLWSAQLPEGRREPAPPHRVAISETLRDWPRELDQRVGQHFSWVSEVFDFFGGAWTPDRIQGGTER